MNKKLELYRRLLVEVEQLEVAVREQGLSKIGGHEVRLKEITQALGLPPVLEFRAATEETWNPVLEEKVLAAKNIRAYQCLEANRKAGTGWGGFLFGSPHDREKREFITDPTIDAWRPVGAHSSMSKSVRSKHQDIEEVLERERDEEKLRGNALLRKWRKAVKLGIRHTKVETEEERPLETPTVVKKKRSTQPGEAYDKLLAGLTAHHKFDHDSCEDYEPIGSNKLCRQVKVAKSTGSGFFEKAFGGVAQYRAACTNKGKLITTLQRLRGEAPNRKVRTFSRNPPGEGGSND